MENVGLGLASILVLDVASVSGFGLCDELEDAPV